MKELLDFYNATFRRSRPSAVKNHRVIVRCQTDAEVNEVAGVLKEKDESVVAIHERFTDAKKTTVFIEVVDNPEPGAYNVKFTTK